jgi:hypothetical protein
MTEEEEAAEMQQQPEAGFPRFLNVFKRERDTVGQCIAR